MAKSYPNWFLWILEQGPIFWIVAVLVIVGPLLGVALYLDDQLDDAEGRLRADLDAIEAHESESNDKYLEALKQVNEELRALKEETRALRESLDKKSD